MDVPPNPHDEYIPDYRSQSDTPAWLIKARTKFYGSEAIVRAIDRQGRGGGAKPFHMVRDATLTIYERDAKISYKERKPKAHAPRTRGTVNGLSKASQKRMRIMARNAAYQFKVEAALTYPREYPHDGREVERHKRAMQKRLLRRGIRIMWCKEFQTMRGVHGFGVAPHMHFMMTKPLFAHDLARMWYEIVGSGDFRHYQAGTHIDWIRNPNNYGTYFAKYMTKTDQKEVPDDFINCGRMWGISRGLLQIVQYMFKTQKAGSVRFLRMFRKWNAAQIRAWYGHRWKRKRGSGGFTAWNGRNFIEAYRGKMQTTTLMS